MCWQRSQVTGTWVLLFSPIAVFSSDIVVGRPAPASARPLCRKRPDPIFHHTSDDAGEVPRGSGRASGASPHHTVTVGRGSQPDLAPLCVKTLWRDRF